MLQMLKTSQVYITWCIICVPEYGKLNKIGTIFYVSRRKEKKKSLCEKYTSTCHLSTVYVKGGSDVIINDDTKTVGKL
jgi:hypothetical protein